jgi:hypothetical protein
MKQPLVVLAVTLATAGCLPTTPGELNNGGFTYFCASPADLACQNLILGATDVPPAIAVGAHFDLQFSGSRAQLTDLVPVASSILKKEASNDVGATGFRFAAPGISAVLARDSGKIVDFLHVTGAPIDALAVVDELGDDVAAYTLGTSNDQLQAIPRDDLGHTLAGALGYTWVSSSEEVLTLTPGLLPNAIHLTAGKPGQATVTVTAGDQSTSVVVTVGGTP